ncbi:GPI ethanolamine phosphate transferase 2 [Liparis tanakae]|uniref:GPI ethanolamine phosphate transferase 2 n=1 Tax=Liparis tanakae TaxID=230148 RepID=A0A4Z2HKM9_9TELE|nr:GPI ethanolamine phosphate transferase 2 [Liparis tanakae]
MTMRRQLKGRFPGSSAALTERRGAPAGLRVLGNSNNIATVDISVGFVGLESYVEAPAVFLTALSTLDFLVSPHTAR